MRHTPGPWHWDSDPMKGDHFGRVRYRVCALGKTITDIYYSSYEGGPTNAEHDARLIAAAPDMYSALLLYREAIDILNDGPDASDVAHGESLFAEARALARAAIAKVAA